MRSQRVAVESLLAHREWVRAVARAVVRDVNAADDVEQEAWLAALRTPPRHGSALRGWLGAVVRSRARRIGRGDARRAAREAAVSRSEASRSAGELAEMADTHRRVVQAVVDLPEPFRRAILLRYFEGLAVSDVAATTGVPLDTARSRISRGLAKLRDRLARELGTERRPLAVALAPLIGGRGEAGAIAGDRGTRGYPGAGTKLAWSAGALLAVAGIGALMASPWVHPASEPPFLAAASAPLPRAAPIPAPAPPLDEAAPPDGVGSAPAPNPDEPRAAPTDAAPVPTLTTAQSLDEARVNLDWNDIPVLEALADLAAQSGVEIAASAEAVEWWGDEDRIEHLKLEDVRAVHALQILARLKGLDVVIEEPRVVIVPREVTRDPARPLIATAAPAANARPLAFKGVVVDARGAPVEKATVVALVKSRSPATGSAVAETDASGAFTFESVRPWKGLFARAPGHVPSRIVEWTGDLGGKDVRLELGGGAAIVEGRVVDCEGREVEGATVHVRNRIAQRAAALAGDRAGMSGTTVTTDASGSFRDASVPAGRLEVVARLSGRFFHDDGATIIRHNGRGEGRTRIEAAPGQTVHVEVRLARPSTWRGVVRDASGKPIAGTVVNSIQKVRCGDDGIFHVEVAAARTLLARIVLPDGRTPERWITLAQSEDRVEDVVIGNGWRIAGRFVGTPSGREPTRVRLANVLPWAPPAPSPLEIGRDGRFAFDDVAPGRYLLQVDNGTETRSWLPTTVVEEIDSAREDLVVRACPQWAAATARVRARFVQDDGRPLAGAFLSASRIGTPEGLVLGKESLGVVVTEHAVPAGRYRIHATFGYSRVGAEWHSSLVLDTGLHEVGRTDLNLGTLVLPPPGSVRLDWVLRELSDDAEVAMRVRRVGESGALDIDVHNETCAAGDLPTVLSLTPGRYVLRATGDGIQGVERTFDLRIGEVGRVDVPLLAAPTRDIALAFPLGAPACARVRISDPAGAFVHQSDITGDEVQVPLRPGRYRIDVDVAETITVRGVLDVPAEGAADSCEVALR